MWAKKVDKREFEKRCRENESRIEALPGRIEAANLSKYRNELRERQEKKMDTTQDNAFKTKWEGHRWKEAMEACRSFNHR